MRDVIVIGAGVGGLSAARELAARGVRVTVVEAGARSAGRIRSERIAGWQAPIELGAEFVHGSPAALLELVKAAGTRLEPAESVHFWCTAGKLAPLVGFWDEINGVLEDVPLTARDQSFAEILTRLSVAPRSAEMLALFVEGFHAGALERISARSVIEQLSTDDDAQTRVADGYASLVSFLERDARRLGVELVTSCPVRRVDWKAGSVMVEAEARSFRGSAAFVALPLGVLAAPPGLGIRFEPELPRFRAGLSALEMGHALRVVVRLREPLWDPKAIPPFAFVHGPELPFNTLWTGAGEPENQPQVTVWSGGPRAERLAQLDLPALKHSVVETLSGVFQAPSGAIERDLLDMHTHRFSRDPLARGAYPYALVGADFGGAFEAEAGTLYFVGDYTDPAELGTVGAAVESALGAARSFVEGAR